MAGISTAKINDLQATDVELKSAITALEQMTTATLENLDNNPIDDRDQYVRDYWSLLQSIETCATRLDYQTLAALCQMVGRTIVETGSGKLVFDETQLMNLSQFPMLLAEFDVTDDDSATAIYEFIEDAGWAGPVTESVPLADTISGSTMLQESDSPLFVEGSSEYFFASDDGDDSDFSADSAECKGDATVVPAIDDESADTHQELDRMQQEVVDLLRSELTDIVAAQREILEKLTDEDQNTRTERLDLQSNQLERIVNACDLVGLDGVSMAVSQIAANVAEMDVASAPLSTTDQALVIDWPIHVLRYFDESFSHKSIGLLLQLLKRTEWTFPLALEEAGTIEDLLRNATITLEEADTAPRQTEARIEDLSLAIPGDVNREILDSLLDELPDHTAEFSATIQSMISNRFVSDIELARRIAHTVKGSCNIVGISGLANMTHQLEDILDELALHCVVPVDKLAIMFLDAADCMESMVEAVLGLGESPSEALPVMQSILDWANHIDNQGIDGITVAAAAPGSSATAETFESVSQDQPEIAKESPESPTETANDAVLRIRASLVDELLRLAGENIISTGQVRSHLGDVQESMHKLDTQNQFLSSLVGELEQLVDVRGIVSKQQRISDGELDDLELERYNELHTSTHRLIEAVIDNIEFTKTVNHNLKALEDVAVVQEKLVRENQESVLKTRMVPVSTSIPRLQRCVRQAVRTSNREVRLEVKGSDTLIDSNVLSELMEPLMHMLRNSVDHGIEPPEDRKQLGKPLEGCIELVFAREGDHINVNVRDDGQGLNKPAILKRAGERGMLAQGQVPTDDDINNMILTPGFSTRDEVTQLSGRGVGMDIVSEKVRSIKGTLTIRSEESVGTTMSIALPVTLLSTHAMIVPVNNQEYAISNFGIEEIIYAGPGDIDYLGEKLVFKHGAEIHGAHFLNEKLGVGDIATAANDAHVGLVVRRSDGARSVMLLESILDSRDLVVKPLLQQIPQVQGIIGATILGDGSVAPVLDLTELLVTTASRRFNPQQQAETVRQHDNNMPFALVVDDSYSARSNLEQFVSDMGFQVRSAKDGMEAVDIIAERVPDILLTDLEMPRMNGIDLATHVRSNDRTCDLPIILITSRSTQKHRDYASSAGVNKYMTKPYSEDDLLQNIDSLLGR